MGLAEAIKLKCNAEKEKYLSVYDVIDIINSDDTELIIHIMDSLDLLSLTVYELNNLDPFNPLYKPICNSYELKQKIIDYRKARRQFIHEDNNFDEYITLQRCLKKNLWSRFDLLKIEKIVKNTSLIVWGDSNALYSMYSDMINRSDSEYYELPKISQQAIKDYINLGSYQRELMNLPSYSPEQIISLMTNDDPACINRDEKYRVYWDMISTAIEAKALNPINDNEQILAEQVKLWLSHYNFILRGFNDNLLSSTDKILAPSVTQTEPKADERRIAELETELAQLNARTDDQQQDPQRTRAQTDETNTDKKLIAMLAILLAKQSGTLRISDRPNATQINEQVYNLTMQIVKELGMNEADMLGLKANIDKISKAVQAHADMFKLSKD
ncbi:hypothetical protein [Psychrobacter sp.]|uniref:hypothetical protein n=1 Tax=Psychrobacter sp. TaxID=56811 RepID=UPI003BB11CFB